MKVIGIRFTLLPAFFHAQGFCHQFLCAIAFLALGQFNLISQSTNSPQPDAFDPNANDTVVALAVQADGKMLVGGNFTAIGGQPRNRIARLNASGSLDKTFNPNANNSVLCLAVQPDGKVLVGGGFTNLCGQTRNRLARFNANGSLDMSFNPNANSSVYCIALQADGSVLVGGTFTNLCGQARSRIARLNVDGSLDSTFNPNAEGGGVIPPNVSSLAMQADEKVLVGGNFTNLCGQPRNYIARLNADGSLDATFNPNANSSVYCLALQADGKVLVGGSFTNLFGQTRNRLARLNADGSLDAIFNPNANSSVYCLALQADGKVLVGGSFANLGGQTRNRLARLNADGSLDATFNPNASNSVYCLALQTDGKLLVGGTFTNLCGQTRNRLARLEATEPATQSLAWDGSAIIWLRGGTSPEVWRTTFESSTDGTNWILGMGVRIQDGWQLTGFAPTANLTLRARGYIFGGYQNGSSWFVESGLGPLLITGQPAGRTNPAGSAVSFVVAASGSEPISYQWRKDGSILIDSGDIQGTTEATLTIGNAQSADAGGYDAVVSNAFGSVTSQVAVLTVLDPAILSQPSSQSVNLGQNVILGVVAGGTEPLTYQWYKDSMPVFTLQSSVVSLTNASHGDAGEYYCVITNTSGSLTSQVAVLTVLDPYILSQPASMGANAGQNVNLGIVAGGTEPLAYQWRKDGTSLADTGKIQGSTSTNLTISNMLGAEAGSYDVVVSNTYGSVTSQVAVVTVLDPIILSQPTSQTALEGQDVSISVTAQGTEPFYYQWYYDGSAILDSTNAQYSASKVQRVNCGNYSVVVSNAYGSVTSKVAELSINLAFPDTFNPNANDIVYAFAVQADGKILAGGRFSDVDGHMQNKIVRINSNGSPDNTFNQHFWNFSGAFQAIGSLVVQPNGQILVGGFFTTVGGQTRNGIARLNADGSLDPAFNPNADAGVCSLVVQPDGKVLVGGTFTNLAGQSRNRIARLNPDGSLDTTFNPDANDYVYSLALQSDGKVIVGGRFTMIGGQVHYCLARLNSDGSLDNSFSPIANVEVVSLVSLKDGKILVGGNFIWINHQPCNAIARLNSDGSVDNSFNPNPQISGGPYREVSSMVVQADGRVVVGGSFASFGGQMRNNIARLNADGSLDSTFNPNANSYVNALALQSDGTLLVGGSFSTISGQSRNCIARLNATEPATQSLTWDGSVLTWIRGGTSPEVWRTTFEYSINGMDWINLGAGERIPDGWQLTGLYLPVNPMLRARGYAAGGCNNGSSWFVETNVNVGPPQFRGLTLNTNGSIIFSLSASPDTTYHLLTSSNLLEWFTNQTLVVPYDGQIKITELQTNGTPKKFFRAQKLE